VNEGTQSRVLVTIDGQVAVDNTSSEFTAVCFDNEAYYVGNTNSASAEIGGSDVRAVFRQIDDTIDFAQALASAINASSENFWAMRSGDNVWVFAKAGGDNNSLTAEEKTSYAADSALISFTNVQTGIEHARLANFSLGGENWGRMEAIRQANEGYSVVLNGRDIGAERDLWIADPSDTTFADYLSNANITGNMQFINRLTRTSFVEVQNASDTPWNGGEVRTQETAQQALVAVNRAIETKDRIRANLGAIQNRLEATISNLTIQAENLQASESRISDVDVATEMTEFTKNNILAQAATSMLAQANSLSGLALTLIVG
jgi:flagellin-like hook-associated protein FlgL